MIHIRTTREFRVKETPDGNAVRVLPMNVSFSFEDEYLGLMALAHGAAMALEPLTPAQQRRLDILQASLDGDQGRVQALLDAAQPPAVAETDTGATKPRKRK